MPRKKYFKQVPAKFDFIANEKEILNWWYKSGVVKKYLNKNKNAKKRFSFMDGPITANNPMGVHHAWGRTLKDLYQRYKNMQGFKQRFQNGFDCQGLWIEVEVEKEKGFKNKKDIEKYGIAKFVKDCKDRVKKYSKIQTQQSIRLGYFMDWDNSYYTMSDKNNYMIWSFLKKCWQEGNLYKGNDAVPWCPRCGTAISQHEISTEEYKQLTHDSVYMRFPVIKNSKTQNPARNASASVAGGPKPETNEFLLVWTTTPWTIPADTILAVSPKIDYAQVEFEGKKYWLAKNLIKDVFNQELRPIKIVNGQDLIRKENIRYYQGPFDDLPIIKKVAENGSNHFHRIVLSKNLVNEQEGTGIVHIVPGAGTEDHQLVKQELGWKDIIFPVVDGAGAYVKNYGFLTGKNAKNNPQIIIEYLQEKNNGYYLFKVKPYTHPYPVCWRCGTELIWRLVNEWYINMDNPRKTDGKTLRERMIEVAKKIHWLPEFGSKRELDWLKNMHDWMISKKRYWGLALPIWECQCGHFETIGSREELKEKAVEGWGKFASPAGGHAPHRPWIDKIKIKCPKCGRLMNRVPDVGNPWLDAGIVSFSTLVDPKTNKVSYLTDKKYWQKWYPADFITECFPGQFRNWFYSLIAIATVLENNNPFKTTLGHALVRDEKGEEMHKSKGNAIWFDEAAEKMGVDTIRWMYCRQNPEFNLNFGYNIANEVRRQYLFLFWNSYRFFVTYANLNGFRYQVLGSSQPETRNQKPETKLDQWILSRLESTKKIATEKLDDYHHHEVLWEIEKLLKDLSTWYIRRSRGRKSCLPTLHYVLKNLCLILAPFIPFLTETIWQEITNSKNSVHLQDWPKVNKKLTNKKLEKQMAAIREVVSLGHATRKEKQIKVRQPLNKFQISNFKFQIDKELAELIKQELNVKEVEIKTGAEKLKVELDTKITPELKTEGAARELIHQVQILRRKARLNLTDKITIFAPGWPKKWEKEVLARTGAVEIKKGRSFKIQKI